jgi:Zn-dependent protease
MFHTPCSIGLHGFGGATIPIRHHQRSYGFLGMAAECFLSFAGPFAGFLLAFLFMMILEVMPDDDRFLPSLFILFLRFTVSISIIWGIFNLLPIYPMDGGHIARELFTYLFPRRGVEFSLILSMMLASLLAVVALRFSIFFAAFLFAYFAYQNYQEMSYRSFR